MAKISDMLLGNEFPPEGNLEPARNVVKKFKKIISRHKEVHKSISRYARMIAKIYISDVSTRCYLLVTIHNMEMYQIDFSKEDVKIEQLEYFLHQEGLKVSYLEGDKVYKYGVSMFN